MKKIIVVGATGKLGSVVAEGLKGTCDCADTEGGCMNSNAGPWNDYVVIDKKIKHKDEVEEEKKEEEGPASASLDFVDRQGASAAQAAYHTDQ